MAYATAQATYNAMVVHSILKLKAGNKVDAWLKEDVIHDHAGHYTDFIEWLQEEDLEDKHNKYRNEHFEYFHFIEALSRLSL